MAAAAGAPHVPAEMIPRADSRREQRLPLRAAGELLFGAGRWAVTVEDFGERGCQLVSPFPLRRGEAVFLSLTLPGLAGRLGCPATVAWASPAPPYRTGVAFGRQGADERARLRRALVGRDPALARPAPALRPGVHLHLGAPPPAQALFSRAERAALRAARDGVTAGALVARLAPHGGEGRRAVSGLVARGLLVAGPAAPCDGRWEALLPPEATHVAPAAPEPNPFAGPEPRPAAAQALYEVACAEGAAGRSGAAVEWLQAALAVAPDDADLSAALDGLTLEGAEQAHGA